MLTFTVCLRKWQGRGESRQFKSKTILEKSRPESQAMCKGYKVTVVTVFTGWELVRLGPLSVGCSALTIL